MTAPCEEFAVAGQERGARPIVALVLAAGLSTRMGAPKLLLPWGSETILARTLRNVQQSAIDDVLLITGAYRQEVTAIAQALGARTVHNSDYLAGEMLSSVQVGIRNVNADTAAIVVALGDMPLIGADTYSLIAAHYRPQRCEIVAPSYRGVRGHPVLFGRALLAELLALPDGANPRDVVRVHGDRLCLPSVADRGVVVDIDDRQSYLRWRPDGG